jgi:ATP adenylyltransferase
MKHLYAPWRGTYTLEAHMQKHLDAGCPFCMNIKIDREKYVIKEYQYTNVLLNLYPYNPGHLLIVPKRHVAHLENLKVEERMELMEVIMQSVTMLEKVLGNTGTNVGLNIGDEAAGGSIPDHLHVHVVPRWKGDTNFMPVTTDTKQLSQDLNIVYDMLKKSFN